MTETAETVPVMRERAVSDWNLSPDRTLIAIKDSGDPPRVACWRLDRSGQAAGPDVAWSAMGESLATWRILGWANPGLLTLWRRDGRRNQLQIVDIDDSASEPVRYGLTGRPISCRVGRSGRLEVLLVMSDGKQAVLCWHCPESDSYLLMAGTGGLSGIAAWDVDNGVVVVNTAAKYDPPAVFHLHRRTGRGYSEVEIGWPSEVRPARAAGYGRGIVGLTGIDGSGQPVPGVLSLPDRTVQWIGRHAGHSCVDVSPSGSQVLAVAWNGEGFAYRVLDTAGNQIGELRSGADIVTGLRFSRDELHLIGWHQSPERPPAVMRWNWRDGEIQPVQGGTVRAAVCEVSWGLRWTQDVGERKIPEWLFQPRSGGHGGIVLFLHGGPRRMLCQTYDPVIAALVDGGWTVVGTNYPGSSGYGLEYQEETRGDWGGADVASIERRLRSLHAEIDARPVCLYGHSYGGYLALMVASLVPQLVKGVAVWAPVTDIPQLWKTSSGTQRRWLEQELGGLRFDAQQMWERSPVGRLPGLLQTRLLVGHGRGDELCPVGQSRQLVDLLDQPTRPAGLVRYLEDSAGSHDPSDWRWWTEAVVAHFEQKGPRTGVGRRIQ